MFEWSTVLLQGRLVSGSASGIGRWLKDAELSQVVSVGKESERWWQWRGEGVWRIVAVQVLGTSKRVSISLIGLFGPSEMVKTWALSLYTTSSGVEHTQLRGPKTGLVGIEVNRQVMRSFNAIYAYTLEVVPSSIVSAWIWCDLLRNASGP